MAYLGQIYMGIIASAVNINSKYHNHLDHHMTTSGWRWGVLEPHHNSPRDNHRNHSHPHDHHNHHSNPDRHNHNDHHRTTSGWRWGELGVASLAVAIPTLTAGGYDDYGGDDDDDDYDDDDD